MQLDIIRLLTHAMAGADVEFPGTGTGGGGGSSGQRRGRPGPGAGGGENQGGGGGSRAGDVSGGGGGDGSVWITDNGALRLLTHGFGRFARAFLAGAYTRPLFSST
jgi:hypothetical protein